MKKLLYATIMSLFFILTIKPIDIVSAQQNNTREFTINECYGDRRLKFVISPSTPKANDKTFGIAITETEGRNEPVNIVVSDSNDQNLPTPGFVNGKQYRIGKTNASQLTQVSGTHETLGGSTNNLTTNPIKIRFMADDFTEVQDSVFYESDIVCEAFVDMQKAPSDNDGNGVFDEDIPTGDPNAACTIQVRTPQDDVVVGGTVINMSKDVRVTMKGPAKDETIKRGVRVLDRRTNVVFDYCVPQNNLIDGTILPNGYGGKWYPGEYEIYITEKCGWFGGPEGPTKCSEIFGVGVGKILKESDSCDITNNRCDKSAPYCIASAYGQRQGVCSVAEKPVKPCKDGICKTALGNFRYSPAGFARSMLTLLLSLSGGILLVFTIINGYKLMVSQGDPEKIKEAREGITGAIAGLLLIIFSIAILQLITVDILGLPGFSR